MVSMYNSTTIQVNGEYNSTAMHTNIWWVQQYMCTHIYDKYNSTLVQ